MALDTSRIRAALDDLAEADPGDAWRWRTGETWSEERLAAFEAEHFTLPADYRAWLRDVGDGGPGFVERGMRPLAGRTAEELGRAAKPFRIKGDAAKPPRSAVGGILRLGEDDQHCPCYLVTGGKRAGEIWIDGDGYGDSVFFKAGTFAELAETWMATVVEAARRQLAPRVAASLEAIAPAERFGHLLYDGFVAWLRQGPEVFAEALAHVAPADRPDRLERFLRCIEKEERRWPHDPELARVAAETLAAILARAGEPVDALDHALDGMYDPDPPDISPERVSAYLDAVATRRGQHDDRLNHATGRWLQHELARSGRVEEATRVWRQRIYMCSSDWAEFARDLVAVGRADVAFAIADERKHHKGQHWGVDDRDRVRAWMHFEAGDRDAAVTWMARHVEACAHCAPELVQLRSKEALQSPPNLTNGWPFERPRARRGQRHHEIIALLHGIGGDADRMASLATECLSRPEIVRSPQELAIHRAHLRMARAIAGNDAAADRDPLVVKYGPGLPNFTRIRVVLATAILARTGNLAIQVEEGGRARASVP